MVNGILYLSMPNRVFAVDARTGRQIWQYVWRGRNAIGNRGVAMYGNALFVRHARQHRDLARRDDGS